AGPGLTSPRSYGQHSLAWHASRFHEAFFREYRDRDVPPFNLPRSEDDDSGEDE
ncbi:hypothetical protein EKO27_g7837, partial [Xylaria grammica]